MMALVAARQAHSYVEYGHDTTNLCDGNDEGLCFVHVRVVVLFTECEVQKDRLLITLVANFVGHHL